MTDTLNYILGAPSNRHYSVFEQNQVLDSTQLNSLTNYLKYQDHLTRVKLLGVGIVGGLQVRQTGNKVMVGKGVGVTSDGDVLTMLDDTVFSNFKPYGQAAPRYDPFYLDTETMRPVFELVRDDQVDAATEPLSALPVDLGKMVVVLLMERYVDDPDLCSGTDCDNLGQTAFDNPRVLLIARGDTSELLKMPQSVSQAAQKLPALMAARPTIAKSITSASALANVYRQSCVNMHQTLSENLGKLDELPTALTGDFVSATAVAKLSEHHAQFSGNNDAGIQYYYDFLKDLVDTWNELREVLFTDESVLCPAVDAFPRHLVLGDLTNPAEFRTGLFPSPLLSGQSETHGQARFLIRKLEAMIAGFQLLSPKDVDFKTTIRVTPSRTEAESLQERAIPWYYSPEIQSVWNYRLARRGDSAAIYGYHISGAEVFGRQIGRYDFFRVEGHVGQDVTAAKAALEQTIASHNLPFTVRAVLLNADRNKIVIRPNIRYGDLHRLHHLLRKDLSLQLAETQTFNGNFKKQIDLAVQDQSIPGQFAEFATQSAQVQSAVAQAVPSLAKRTFSEYQQSRQNQDWREGFKSVVNVSNSFKGAFGEVSRTDYSTPFDTLLTNNHPAWLEWLEALIQSKDQQEDSKLLFPAFCQQHPSLEHFGGVIRGGTLVLIYNDQARVVADFMLPYNWVDVAENEPSEPEQLPDPVYKRPEMLDRSVKLQPPLASKFKREFLEYDKAVQEKIKKQVTVQEDQFQFLVNVGKNLGGKATVVDPRLQITDPVLRSHLAEVEFKQQQVDDLREVIFDPATPEDIRLKSGGEVERLELELAESIRRSSTFLDDSKIAVEPGGDGGKAVAILTAGMGTVTGSKAAESLRGSSANLKSTQLQQVFKLRGF